MFGKRPLVDFSDINTIDIKKVDDKKKEDAKKEDDEPPSPTFGTGPSLNNNANNRPSVAEGM
jgi:hypothetical protein